MQVRDEMSAEAAARQQALGGLRKHVGDELKATQRGVASKLEKTDKELAAHEQALAKLERALAMVKEDVTGEKDSREALKMTLSHAIEVVGDPTRCGEVVDGTALVLDALLGRCTLGMLRLEHAARRRTRYPGPGSLREAQPRLGSEPYR